MKQTLDKHSLFFFPQSDQNATVRITICSLSSMETLYWSTGCRELPLPFPPRGTCCFMRSSGKADFKVKASVFMAERCYNKVSLCCKIHLMSKKPILLQPKAYNYIFTCVSPKNRNFETYLHAEKRTVWLAFESFLIIWIWIHNEHGTHLICKLTCINLHVHIFYAWDTARRTMI